MATPFDPNKYSIGMSKAPILPTPTGNPITAPSTSKARTVKPLAQMTVAEAQASGQMDAYNKLVGGYTTPVIDATKPISTNQLKPTTGTYNPPPARSPAASNALTGINTTLEKITQGLAETQRQEEMKTDTTTRGGMQSYITDILNKQANAPEEAAKLRETALIAEKEATARKLGTDITSKKRAYEKQIDDLRKNPEGKLRGAIEAEISELSRKANSELADMSIQYEVANGDYQAAQKIVNQQIEDINKSYDNQLQTAQIAYNFLQDDLTESEKIQAQAKIQEINDKRDFEQQKALLGYKATLDKNGVTPPGTISSLSQSVIDNPSLFYNFTPTQKAQIVSELQSNGYDISNLQKINLSSGQQSDMADMNTVKALIDGVLGFKKDNTLPGIGYQLGTLKGIGAQLGFGTDEEKSVRANIGNIKGTIAKLRGGTSFTPNESRLLDTYTPTINDSSSVAINKLENLKKFIDTKNASLLGSVTINPSIGQVKKQAEVVTRPEDLRAKYGY